MDQILSHNGLSERYFGAKTLTALKDGIEDAICEPGPTGSHPKGMSMRRLLIVGNRVGHDIQRIVLNSSDKLKARKQEFREMMRKRIDE